MPEPPHQPTARRQHPRAALRKLQESYLHGIELQIKRLTDPLDARAADQLRIEIAAVEGDARRFERLMRGSPDGAEATLLPLETPAVASGSIKLLYKCMEAHPGANQLKPHFRLVNTTNTPIPLSELTIRYWFTNEGRKPLKHWCDYSSVGNPNLKATFTRIKKRPGADHHLEIGFSAGSGTLVKGTDVDIQSRSAKDDWSVFQQGDDYSFDPARTDYAESPKVTLYQNGTLIFGTEP